MNTIYPIFDDIREHRVRGRCIYPLNDLLKPKGRFFCNPTRRPTMRLQPLHPRPRFFVLFHPSQAHHPTNPTIPPQKRNIPYWYCPLCTPSLTLPPSSLKCLQKSNPNIPKKCLRCFKCFGCFRCNYSAMQ